MPIVPDVLGLHRLKVPLREPYHLSFGPVLWLDTIIVEATADGSCGYGEATVLTGYTDETIEDAWSTARALARRLADDYREGRSALRALAATHPFTATAFATAFEMLEGSRHLKIDQPASVPLVGLLHAREEPAMTDEIDELLHQGYRTLKLKVGFDVERDIAFVRAAQRACRGRARLRIDANQGYDAAQAQRFVTALEPEGIELFEQPCAAGDWASHMAVARVSPLPLMLDESIYGLDDIERAAELEAAAFIKVKLMKLGSLDALAASIARIRALGMQPVLGNGVASDVGCWMEACIAVRHIDNAGEMNGHLKTCGSLLRDPLPFCDGAIRLEPDHRVAFDHDALARYAVDRWAGAVRSPAPAHALRAAS